MNYKENMKTFKKWNKKGRYIFRGEKAQGFNKKGKALFHKSQTYIPVLDYEPYENGLEYTDAFGEDHSSFAGIPDGYS